MKRLILFFLLSFSLAFNVSALGPSKTAKGSSGKKAKNGPAPKSPASTSNRAPAGPTTATTSKTASSPKGPGKGKASTPSESVANPQHGPSNTSKSSAPTGRLGHSTPHTAVQRPHNPTSNNTNKLPSIRQATGSQLPTSTHSAGPGQTVVGPTQTGATTSGRSGLGSAAGRHFTPAPTRTIRTTGSRNMETLRNDRKAAEQARAERRARNRMLNRSPAQILGNNVNVTSSKDVIQSPFLKDKEGKGKLGMDDVDPSLNSAMTEAAASNNSQAATGNNSAAGTDGGVGVVEHFSDENVIINHAQCMEKFANQTQMTNSACCQFLAEKFASDIVPHALMSTFQANNLSYAGQAVRAYGYHSLDSLVDSLKTAQFNFSGPGSARNAEFRLVGRTMKLIKNLMGTAVEVTRKNQMASVWGNKQSVESLVHQWANEMQLKLDAAQSISDSYDNSKTQGNIIDTKQLTSTHFQTSMQQLMNVCPNFKPIGMRAHAPKNQGGGNMGAVQRAPASK